MNQRTYAWGKIEANDVVPDFTILTEEEIRQITLGIYQVKMAKSYTAKHVQEDGNYEILDSKITENVVVARIQSCHVSAKKYLCWIRYQDGVVTSWYCKCKSGSRFVGCFAHITSVVWYLSFGRHQQKPVLGVRDWAVPQEEAARVINETDSDEESGPEE